MNGFGLTACLEYQGPSVLPDHPHCHTLKPGCKGGVCLFGEKPDEELPGVVGAR